MASTDQIYRSVKIAAPILGQEAWDVCKWATEFLDDTKPFMVVQHKHGESRQLHWHVVGISKSEYNGSKKKDVEKTLKYAHPLRAGRLKPLQEKKKLYDREHFNYLLKPKEWSKQGSDMILLSSFTDDEVAQMVEASRVYHEQKKLEIQTIVNRLELCEDPAEFHLKAVNEVLQQLKKADKDPGPWVTHKVRSAVWTRDTKYQKYIAKKYM